MWVQTGPDGYDYQVVPIRGDRAVKAYRCPGCDHEVRAGVPHVAVWRTDDADGADRRHWHSACWSYRGRRGPSRRRS